MSSVSHGNDSLNRFYPNKTMDFYSLPFKSVLIIKSRFNYTGMIVING